MSFVVETSLKGLDFLEIEKMREICKIVALAHEEIKKHLNVRNYN